MAFRRGERQAFEEIVREHQFVVHGFVRARVLQAPVAEGLTREVFLRSFAARRSLTAEAKLRPWLLGIARSVLKERARRLLPRRDAVWTDLCLELDDLVRMKDSTLDALLACVPGCLESLGPPVRQVVELYYSGHLCPQEIGSRIRRSESAVKLLLLQARQALLLCIGSKCEDPGRDR